MATYNVTGKINEIAELTNKTNKEIARELKIDFNETELKKVDGEFQRIEIADKDLEFTAWNKREQNAVIGKLEELKKEEEQKEIKAKRLSGYRWVLENSKWVVAGNFTGKQIGDKVTVVKASGSESVQEILDFTEAGNAIVK